MMPSGYTPGEVTVGGQEPRALLLDGPLGALDLKLRQTMRIHLERIRRDVGITFVYVTHDQSEAFTMSG